MNYAQLFFFLPKHIYFSSLFDPAASSSSKCAPLCSESKDSRLVEGKYRWASRVEDPNTRHLFWGTRLHLG